MANKCIFLEEGYALQPSQSAASGFGCGLFDSALAAQSPSVVLEPSFLCEARLVGSTPAGNP
jgi:hypothetical protein